MRNLLPLVLLLACGPDEEDAPPAIDAEEGFLWHLDPARCVSPCTGDPGPRLIAIDGAGNLTPRSALRVDVRVRADLAALVDAAAADGVRLWAGQGFRSYDEQLELFRKATEIGRTARPGHSEHQLGTAIDFDWDDPRAPAWLADRAPEHGFVLSFPAGEERATGIRHEPWHYRWVGRERAAAVRASGRSLAAFLRENPDLARAGDCGDCPAPESREPCDDATATCDGDVLRFCVDDAAAAVDCATAGLTCAVEGCR